MGGWLDKYSGFFYWLAEDTENFLAYLFFYFSLSPWILNTTNSQT